jgi:hypothetical protein
VIVEPPFEPAAQFIVIVVYVLVPAVRSRLIGFEGTVAAQICTVFEFGLEPTTFTATIRIK